MSVTTEAKCAEAIALHKEDRLEECEVKAYELVGDHTVNHYDRIKMIFLLRCCVTGEEWHEKYRRYNEVSRIEYLIEKGPYFEDPRDETESRLIWSALIELEGEIGYTITDHTPPVGMDGGDDEDDGYESDSGYESDHGSEDE